MLPVHLEELGLQRENGFAKGLEWWLGRCGLSWLFPGCLTVIGEGYLYGCRGKIGTVNWYCIEADSLSGDNRLFHYIGACKRFALFRELQKAESTLPLQWVPLLCGNVTWR